MKAVLYTHDLEPITVLQLQPWAVEYLQRHRSVRLAVTPPLPDFPVEPLPTDMTCVVRTVTITADWLFKDGHRTMMLFTRDEESALLLRAAFLPGQTRELREREAEAFSRGFLYALDRLGDR